MHKGEGRGHLIYPLKRLQKIRSQKCNKSIKHKNRGGPPPRFSHNPKYPLKKIWKGLCIYYLDTFLKSIYRLI
jgi:hypothetical protein